MHGNEKAIPGAKSGSRFVFCDISTEMLAISKDRFHLTNTQFITSSGQELSYKEEFDVITAIQVNHYGTLDDERAKAVQNSYNALKNDGIFITFENYSLYSNVGETLYLRRWQNYQMQQGKSMESSREHVGRYGKDYYPISISEHMEVMKAGGFNVVEILWVSYLQVGLLGIKTWEQENSRLRVDV